MVREHAFGVIPGLAYTTERKFPYLFEIYYEQDLTVAAATNNNWGFTFKRWVPIDLQSQMRGLHIILSSINLNSIPNMHATKDGSFFVKSLYKHLCSDRIDRTHVESKNFPEDQDLALADLV
jgi:hypothetical protein